MRIIHIMSDGSTRESIEGLVIKNEDFYRAIQGLLTVREMGKGTK